MAPPSPVDRISGTPPSRPAGLRERLLGRARDTRCHHSCFAGEAAERSDLVAASPSCRRGERSLAATLRRALPLYDRNTTRDDPRVEIARRPIGCSGLTEPLRETALPVAFQTIT